MSNIQTYLDEIRSALYGEEVRSSIINAINQCYQDAADGVKPEFTVETLTNGVRVNVTVGDETTSFTVNNGTSTVLVTRQVTSQTVNCAAGGTGYVDIPVTVPDGYTFIGVIRTWALGATIFTNSMTTDLSSNEVRVHWANWSSRSESVTLTANLLYTYSE